MRVGGGDAVADRDQIGPNALWRRRLLHQCHWRGRKVHDLGCDRSKKQASDRPHASRSHDDQITAELSSKLDDRRRGISDNQMALAGNLAPREHFKCSGRLALAALQVPALDQRLLLCGKQIRVPYRGLHIDDVNVRPFLLCDQSDHKLRCAQRASRSINRQSNLQGGTR